MTPSMWVFIVIGGLFILFGIVPLWLFIAARMVSFGYYKGWTDWMDEYYINDPEKKDGTLERDTSEKVGCPPSC